MLILFLPDLKMALNQTPDTATYSFNEHRHRYAVWTAARAVQRSFTSTDKIQTVIEFTSLRKFAEENKSLTGNEYDLQQRQWCHDIMDAFGSSIQCSYGRGAKIVAIYLKTAIILPSQGSCELCEVIHPPVDSILLTNLVKQKKLQKLAGKRWTNFSNADYWNVVDIIRTSVGFFNWKLEAYWQPQQQTLQTTE